MNSDELILVTTTNNDRIELETIAKTLIDKQLAACCQISSPIESFFSWEGKIEGEQEWTCSIKTIRQHFEAIEKVIRELHHYDVAQIIALEVTLASESYREWAVGSVNS